MNKSYTPSEVISLFYDKLLLETIPQEELKERMKSFSDNVSSTPNIQEVIQKSVDIINSKVTLTESEKNYAISRNQNYLEPNYMFDLVPLATVLNNSNYDKVIERKEDGTLIDLSTDEVINKEDLKNSNGKYVIIEREDSGITFFNFSIVEKGELFQTRFSFEPKGIREFPITSISKTRYAKLDPSNNNFYHLEQGNYKDDDRIFLSKAKADESATNQIISALYASSFDKKTDDLNIRSLISENSSSKLTDIVPEGRAQEFEIDVQSYFELAVFNSMLCNTPNIEQYYTEIQNARIIATGGPNFPKRLFNPKESFSIDYNENSLGMDDIAHYNELSKIELAKHMQMNDSINEISQNSNDNIQNKLQSEEFKEFQAKREEREQKQQELQEKIAVENQTKENWQNSPEHPENLRKAELSKFKQTIEVLDQLKKVNPTLLSKEQLEYLDKSQEFFEMYEKENNREHEVDTGMSEESRNWYQEHYTGMSR